MEVDLELFTKFWSEVLKKNKNIDACILSLYRDKANRLKEPLTCEVKYVDEPLQNQESHVMPNNLSDKSSLPNG